MNEEEIVANLRQNVPKEELAVTEPAEKPVNTDIQHGDTPSTMDELTVYKP